jgi:hypothetical protein
MAEKRITVTGIVYGNCWGGGQSGFKARKIEGDTLKEVKDEAKRMLEDGSLDSGMGFESLNGAVLEAKIKTIKMINGEEYINTKHLIFTIGKTTKFQREQIYNQQR